MLRFKANTKTTIAILLMLTFLTTAFTYHANAASPLANKSFETGNFNGWTVTVPSGATAEVVTSHQGDQGTNYAPKAGYYFVRIKTDGPGSYTTVAQTFYATAGQVINGYAAFDARDYMPYNDEAMVRILNSAGTEIARPWYSSVSVVGNYADGPWTYWSWTAPSNGYYTLEHRIANTGDSGYDSYALFDGYNAYSPVAEADGPYVTNEGTPVYFTAAGSTDLDGDGMRYRWDFSNDGTYDTAWSTSPTASYTWYDDWAGYAKVQVSDGQYTSTDLAGVNVVNVAPQVQAGLDRTVNEGSSITLTGSFTDPGTDTYTIEWDFGDGQKASGSLTVTHVYMDSGTYTATLKVTDDNGGVGTDSLVVTVLDLSPTAGFSWSPEPQNEGAIVSFNDLSTSYPDNIVSWYWDFGTGMSAEQNPTFTFMDNGAYTVKLTVTDEDGSVSSVSHVVNILDLSPTAEFSWSPEPQNEGASVGFSDLSTSPCDNVVSWHWDFGDGSTSTEQNPNHVYVDNGIYTVTSTITDEDGSVSYVSHDVNILDLEPTADFSSSPEPSLEGSDVAFTDLSTSSPDTIVSWNWNFGDGETASDANPVHTYADDGIYTVTLTVTDEDGSTDTISHIVTILNVAPAVQAGADQTADEGSIISFDGSFTDPGADTHTVIWDFGDGEMAEGTLTPTHTYVDEGTYTVKLTVTDDDGGEGSATLIVVVNNVPPITEAGSDMTANEGDTISFSGEFTDPGSLDTQTVQWDFGDGTSPVDGTLSPTHVFAEDGEYTVTLTVTDNDGGVGTDTLIVTVYNVAPAVDAGVDQTVDEGSPVTFAGSFTDPGTLDTHSVTWNFGDGTEPAVDTLAPTHTYADNGVYTVTLTVVDDDGAEGTDTLTVTVNNVAPTVEAGPDQTATEGSSVTFNGEFTDPGWLDTHAITWDFGDGTPQVSGVLDPSHVYGDDGVYTVTLNVSDNNGGTQTDSLTVTVGNVAPQVNAGSDIVGEERDTIVFSGTFTDPGLDTYTIAWNFGDGTSATGTLTPMHAYERCGSYTVTLTVTDDDGGVGSDTLTVNVKGPRTIKGDALSLLVSVRTGDKKVDWAIECAMKLVRCSLNSQFWADGDHLAVTRHGYCGWQPTGKMVFIYEGLAIGEMQCSMEFWIKKGPTPQQQQAIDLFKTVISKLVKADQLLVRTAIDEAKRMTPPTNNCRLNAYKMAVSNAEKAYGRALCYLSSNKPELALVNFMQAWEHAQLAMELAC